MLATGYIQNPLWETAAWNRNKCRTINEGTKIFQEHATSWANDSPIHASLATRRFISVDL